MRILFALALAFALAGTTSAPAAAASVNLSQAAPLCGTLQALTRTDAQPQEDRATIDGRTYWLSAALSYTIGPGVAIGARVCLFGEVVPGTVLIKKYTLTLCAAGSAAAGCSATLPLTSTEGGFPSLPVLAAQLVLVVLICGFCLDRVAVHLTRER